jgi:tetratricopeptide (TPR) repeat protein
MMAFTIRYLLRGLLIHINLIKDKLLMVKNAKMVIVSRTLTDKQLDPPKDENEFQIFALDFFRERWSDPKANQNGIKGSTQNGVDVFGLPKGEDGYSGVQCKLKDRQKGVRLVANNNPDSKDDIYSEIEKAKTFTPKLKEFIIVTTASRDTKIQATEREINLKHKKEGLFGFQIMFWEDFVDAIPDMPLFRTKWYPYHFGTMSSPSSVSVKQSIKNQNTQLLESNVSGNNQINVQADNINIVVNQENSDDDKVHHAKVDTAKKFLESNNPEKAISELESLQKEIWSQCDEIIKFRILANLGVGYGRIGQIDKMAKFFIEALQYNPKDEKALLNSAVGYLLIDNKIEASKKIKEALDKNPQSGRAYSLKIESELDSFKKVEDILALIPKSLHEDFDVAHAISRFAKQNQSYNLDEAEKWLRVALKAKPKDDETQSALAEVLLQEVIDDPMVVFAQHIDEKNKNKLKESIELFTEAWEQIENSELKKYKTSILINRSMAKGLTDRKEAINDIDLAIKANPENANAVRSKAGILFELGKKEDAIKWLEDNTKALETDPSLTFMLAGMLRDIGQTDKAITALNDLIKKPNGETEGHDAKRLLIQLYLDQKKYDKAKEIVSQLPDTPQLKVLNLLETSRIKFSEGLESESVEDLLEAKRISNSNTPKRQKLELANVLYSSKKFTESAELFEDLISEMDDDDITKRFINSLYQDGQYKKALEKIDLLKLKIGLNKYIVEVETSIYDDIGDLVKSEETCSEYLKKNQEDKEIRIRLGVTKLRLGKDKEEILETLKPIQTIDGLSFEYSSQLARLYKDIGEGLKSLDFAYEIRRSFHSVPEAHLYYMGIFLDREKENEDYFEKDICEIDTVVKYKNSMGAEDMFILEDRKNADMRLHEVNKENELYEKFSGKKIGDEIEINSISKEKITISQIQSKYVYAFQEVMSKYNTMFPSGQGLVGFTFDSSTPEKQSESVKKMLDQVAGVSKQVFAVEEFYNKGQLTVGAFAGILEKSPIEIFGGLMATQTAKLRVALGTTTELKESVEYLHSFANPKILIDITSLISIKGIDVADKVVQKYGKLGITQSTIDLITEIIAKNKGAGSKGYMNIAKEGENFTREEFSAEIMADRIVHFENLRKWVFNNCEIVAIPPEAVGNPEKRRETEHMLGKSFSDTLIIASQKKHIFYTDDERLRSYAKSEYGIEGVWTQLIINELLKEKFLTDDECNLATVKMVNSNYYYTMINNRIVFRAGKEAKWDIANPMFVKMLDLLSEDNTDYLSGGSVAVEFFYLLWADSSISDENKKKITSYTISVLTRKRENKIEILANIKKLIEKFFITKPFVKEEIIAIIEGSLTYN